MFSAFWDVFLSYITINKLNWCTKILFSVTECVCLYVCMYKSLFNDVSGVLEGMTWWIDIKLHINLIFFILDIFSFVICTHTPTFVYMFYSQNRMCKFIVCRQDQCLKKESYIVTRLLLTFRVTQYCCVVFYSFYSTNMAFNAELYCKCNHYLVFKIQ